MNEVSVTNEVENWSIFVLSVSDPNLFAELAAAAAAGSKVFRTFLFRSLPCEVDG